MSIAAAALLALCIGGSLIAGAVVLLALLGTPLMAILGGSAEILWLLHPDEAYRHLRFIAPTVLDERFSDNPVVVTIPLFTFVGFVLAEARTPDRLVAGARSVLGWLPGGLAIVCIIASAVFTVLTGGSGVTIIAVGGLLYPALRKQGYSEPFALGLVTTGGSVGLLLPSLPLGAYALLTHLDLASCSRRCWCRGFSSSASSARTRPGWRTARESPGSGRGSTRWRPRYGTSSGSSASLPCSPSRWAPDSRRSTRPRGWSLSTSSSSSSSFSATSPGRGTSSASRARR